MIDNAPLFRVIIAGTRTFTDYTLLQRECNHLLSEKQRTHNIVVVSGTARGADTLGERYARERGFQLRRFPADWDKDGKKAGMLRNYRMADNADALIAFWDGESHGTKHMIEYAKSKGLNVYVFHYNNKDGGKDSTRSIRFAF